MNAREGSQTLSPGQIASAAVLLTRAGPSSKVVFYFPLFTALTTLTLLMIAVTSGWLGKGAHVGSRFGETSRAGIIKQPVNTFSSLGFVFTGLCMGWRLKRGAARQKPKPLAQKIFFNSFFASLVVCVGPGSMAMHATETRLGGRLDLLSMYMVAAFLTVYGLWRFFRLGRIWFLPLFGLVVALCFRAQDLHYSMPLIRNFDDFIFGLLILVGAVFEALNFYVRKLDQDFKWAALSLGLLLIAFLIWNLSLQQAPSRSVLQGHAIWHLLCAVAAYCLFKYYASERSRLSPEAVGQAKDQAMHERLLGGAAASCQPVSAG